MESQKEAVSGFFENIAGDYKSKYTGRNAFHNYFFLERLEEATRGFEFDGKSILDIGAGTGDLYDELTRIAQKIDYYAVDISSKMLESSKIPENRRFSGYCYETTFPIHKFDYIFMLGVTTYLDEIELAKTLDFIQSGLKKDGTAIITFTNKTSLDWRSRSFFKFFARNFMPKANVLSQGFTIYPKNLVEAVNVTKDRFHSSEIRWLNHTVFPFSQLFKSSSSTLARYLHTRLKQGKLLSFLSSDFLMILRNS